MTDLLDQADYLADEATVLSATPSFLVVEWRGTRRLYSLLTGVAHTPYERAA